VDEVGRCPSGAIRSLENINHLGRGGYGVVVGSTVTKLKETPQSQKTKGTLNRMRSTKHRIREEEWVRNLKLAGKSGGGEAGCKGRGESLRAGPETGKKKGASLGERGSGVVVCWGERSDAKTL